MTLLELISTPEGLSDIHLFDDCEETSEVYTVVELKSDTFSTNGLKEWSDVLNAKVVQILEGIYGTHETPEKIV